MTQSHQASPSSEPIDIAIISNVPTPYRIALHRRVIDELPEIRLHSIFTHTKPQFDWKLDGLENINPIWMQTSGASAPRISHLLSHWQQWKLGGRIARYLHQHRIRAVIINGYNNMTRLRLIAHLHRHNIPVFVRGDSNVIADRDLRPARQWLKSRLLQWVIHRSSGMMCMGTLGQQYFEKYGEDPERIYRFTLLPDYEFFETDDPQDRRALREQFNLPEDRRYIIYSGRLVQVKRVDTLIDAYAQLADQLPDWDLLIAGDGVLRDSLKARVPQAVRDRVHWLGFLDAPALRSAYHMSEVLVLPSSYEPWALVVNEAMAAGLVVVSSNVVGAAGDLVVDGESGRTFEPGDIHELAEALLDVTQPQRLESMKQCSAQILQNWRTEADPVVALRHALHDVGVL